MVSENGWWMVKFDEGFDQKRMVDEGMWQIVIEISCDKGDA